MSKRPESAHLSADGQIYADEDSPTSPSPYAQLTEAIVTAKDSHLTHQEVGQYIDRALSLYQEYPWRFECDVMADKIRILMQEQPLKIALAELMDALFEVTEHTPDDFEHAVWQGLEWLEGLNIGTSDVEFSDLRISELDADVSGSKFSDPQTFDWESSELDQSDQKKDQSDSGKEGFEEAALDQAALDETAADEAEWVEWNLKPGLDEPDFSDICSWQPCRQASKEKHNPSSSKNRMPAADENEMQFCDTEYLNEADWGFDIQSFEDDPEFS